MARMSKFGFCAGVDSSEFPVSPPLSVRTKVLNLPAAMPLFGLPKRTARRSTLVGVRYVSAQRGAVLEPLPPPPPPPPLPQLAPTPPHTTRLPLPFFSPPPPL